jgi:cell division protein FtsI (penicillin-binding protein 3)
MQKKRSLISPWTVCTLSLLLILAFSVVLAQFYKLQILQHEYWLKKAAAQQQMRIDLGAKRGAIYGSIASADQNNDVCLAQDVPTFHLYVDASSIPLVFKRPLAQLLAPLVDLPLDDILTELNKVSRFRKIKWYVDLEQKLAIDKAFKKFIKKKPIAKNALFFLAGYKRVYPLGSLAGSLLHTLGTQEGQRGPERIPTGGLEKRFEDFLKGVSGQLTSYRTPKGRLDATHMVVKPQNGYDLYLTLNPLIQTVVEKELEQAVIRAKAKGGWALIMDPFCGHILACAQVPSLNLLSPESFLSDPLKTPYLNLKALTDPFEPGSIMKPLTMLVALKANHVLGKPVFNPQEKVASLDGKFPGRKSPIKDVKAVSYLNMDMAIQKSSNIYMGRVIQKVIGALGDPFYEQELKNTFGFGSKTGLKIGVESSGFVPSLHKKMKGGGPQWSQATPFSLAMGYNLLATTLQMTKAYAMIANGGYEVEPCLIKKIVKNHEHRPQEILYELPATPLSKQKIPYEDVLRIKQSMQFSVNKGGTAFRAKVPGFTACGKTATTEKLVAGTYSHDQHISTFAGFAPSDHPRFVCLIVIDEPKKMFLEGIGKNQFGGVCAAPSFATIAAKSLEILGLSPDDPGSLNKPQDSKFYPEIKKLEDLYLQWNH